MSRISVSTGSGTQRTVKRISSVPLSAAPLSTGKHSRNYHGESSRIPSRYRQSLVTAYCVMDGVSSLSVPFLQQSKSHNDLCHHIDKYARKIHYSCDAFFAITWALVTGFNSPFPWFYPVFFSCMIVHRAWRDNQRCAEKYGEAWKEYQRRVPYLFIPVCIPSLVASFKCD
jgi:hypothetical protein